MLNAFPNGPKEFRVNCGFSLFPFRFFPCRPLLIPIHTRSLPSASRGFTVGRKQIFRVSSFSANYFFICTAVIALYGNQFARFYARCWFPGEAVVDRCGIDFLCFASASFCSVHLILRSVVLPVTFEYSIFSRRSPMNFGSNFILTYSNYWNYCNKREQINLSYLINQWIIMCGILYGYTRRVSMRLEVKFFYINIMGTMHLPCTSELNQ